MSVTSEITVYEVDDKELSPKMSGDEALILQNHWNRGEFIVLELSKIPEGATSITVTASDLVRAISACGKAHRG